MDVLSVENILLPLSTSYIGDEDLAFISRKLVCEEGIQMFKENYLLSAVDARINNYSSLYLTKKTLGEDIFTFKKQNTKKQVSLTVSLLKPNTTSAIYIPEGDIIEIDPIFSNKRDNNTVFELEFVNRDILRIAHQRGSSRYYLNVIDSKFTFSSSIINYPATTFNYLLSDDQLYLFRITNTTNQIVMGRNGILELTDSIYFVDNYFKVERFTQTIKPVLNASWVSYNSIRKNTLEINPEKSVSNIPLNYLITNQYSYITDGHIPSNFIALKNQLTVDNYNHRVDITEKHNNNIPSVNRRDYTCLVTGCEQEKGDYNITLPFEFYTADYKFLTDKYTKFVLPESLYPYEGINVNDAAINIAGAIGGDTPYTSDKIFFKDKDRFVADGQYLCTWLFAAPGTPGVWLDRYYYPEQSTYIAALTSENTNILVDAIDDLLNEKLAPSAYYDVTYLYSLSSEELLHTPQTNKDALRNNFYFDKKSDLIFLPNNEYIYHRIGDAYVDSIVSALSSYLIQDGLTVKTSKNSPVVNDTGEYVFDNNSYALVESYRGINNSSQATISFWIDTPDWTKPVGHQILGNLNDRGFAIINDPIVTPLIQLQDNLKVLTLNSNFEVINTSYISPVDFSPIVKTKTEINYLYSTVTYFITAYYIKDIIRTDHLDTFLPITVSYSLTSLDQKSIFTDPDGGGGDKVTPADTCPRILIDNPAVDINELLLADNVRLKVGNVPLTGIIIEPCSL